MDGLWFEDALEEHCSLRFKIEEVYFVGKSKFQTIKVASSYTFGKLLVLDNKVQSAEKDEMIYHESLVQPAMLLHPNPKSVYIGGGGELGTAREVLKHKCVEKCVMVDIDEEVVKMCEEHLPEWGGKQVTGDKRLELIFDDALSRLRDYKGTFDVIIMDINDPLEGGPGLLLYTSEFYRDIVRKKLNPGGIFVTQSGGADFMTYKQCFTTVHNTLKNTFDQALGYNVHIPSFGGSWGFNLAWNGECSPENDPRKMTSTQLEERIRTRFGENSPLRYLDGNGLTRMFAIEKQIQEGMDQETQVITENNLIYMHHESKN